MHTKMLKMDNTVSFSPIESNCVKKQIQGHELVLNTCETIVKQYMYLCASLKTTITSGEFLLVLITLFLMSFRLYTVYLLDLLLLNGMT